MGIDKIILDVAGVFVSIVIVSEFSDIIGNSVSQNTPIPGFLASLGFSLICATIIVSYIYNEYA